MSETVPAGLERYGWPPPPRANWRLAGHEVAEQVLLEAFTSKRLPHAWLIAGPRGVGKATLAFRFARFVLSAKERKAVPPPGSLLDDDFNAHPSGLFVEPEHPVFRRIASGAHAGLLTIERGVDERRGAVRSEVVVDDVRGVRAFFANTSAEGGWRVVIVDAADEMNRHAANALLKVLEEPPDRSLLLLVSHTPGGLFATIRSRCCLLSLKPLPEATVASLVCAYRPDASDGDASRLAAISKGSIGRALSLSDNGCLALRSELTSVLGNLPDIDAVALHRLGDYVGRSGNEELFQTANDLVREWLFQVIRYAATDGDPNADKSKNEDSEGNALLRRLARAASLERWLEVWEKSSGLLKGADGANLDSKQVLLNVVLNMANAVRS